jgi:Icc-related predicted phosphoesterase
VSESQSILAGELWLKILVVSDFHGNLNSAEALASCRLDVKTGGEINAAVICGDLSELGSLDRGLKVLEEVQNGFENVFYVTGNHDPPSLIKHGIGETSEPSSRMSPICLHGRVVSFHDLTFIGLSGFHPPFYGKWDIEGLPITRDSEVTAMLDGLFTKAVHEFHSDKHRTVLVTHDPPFGVCDRSVLTKTNAGSQAIMKAILKWNPLAALCGHIHEGRGIATLGNTLVINPGSIHFREAAYLEIKDLGAAEAKLIKI